MTINVGPLDHGLCARLGLALFDLPFVNTKPAAQLGWIKHGSALAGRVLRGGAARRIVPSQPLVCVNTSRG